MGCSTRVAIDQSASEREQWVAAEVMLSNAIQRGSMTAQPAGLQLAAIRRAVTSSTVLSASRRARMRLRALLVHLELVTIHPFMDGNGRLGRLLMNYALLSEGVPWVTIRSDERVPFFRAIERAHVDDQASSFIEFMWHLVREAVRNIGTRAESQRPGRRASAPSGRPPSSSSRPTAAAGRARSGRR